MSNPAPTSKGAGRPKKPFIQRAPGQFKTAATGETRNSPYTDPNILFWVGLTLIVFAGWSSGRLATIFKLAWSPDLTKAKDFKNASLSTIAQLIFLFLLVVSARAAPPLARIWLVILIGVAVIYLVKNPQALTILSKLGQK